MKCWQLRLMIYYIISFCKHASKKENLRGISFSCFYSEISTDRLIRGYQILVIKPVLTVSHAICGFPFYIMIKQFLFQKFSILTNLPSAMMALMSLMASSPISSWIKSTAGFPLMPAWKQLSLICSWTMLKLSLFIVCGLGSNSLHCATYEANLASVALPVQ